jgi:hypothetical protein
LTQVIFLVIILALSIDIVPIFSLIFILGTLPYDVGVTWVVLVELVGLAVLSIVKFVKGRIIVPLIILHLELETVAVLEQSVL